MGTARRPPSSLGGQKPLTITERERETEEIGETPERSFYKITGETFKTISNTNSILVCGESCFPFFSYCE